ncbi:MAG: protein-disulfide reductase DsbD [Glaciimonas sp.]|nr:protein-disulfide reductase DsbD [Glaciimonas sp.]
MLKYLFPNRSSIKSTFAWILLITLLGILLSPRAFAKENFLEPEAAFKFSAKLQDSKTIKLTFAIADGYYMYRERFQFKAAGATLGTPELPHGIIKYDTTFEKDVESYRKQVTITIPVQASAPFVFTVISQGCTDQGLCYAPMESVAKLSPTGSGGLLAAVEAMQGTLVQSDASSSVQASQMNAAPRLAVPAVGWLDSGMNGIELSLESRKLLVILPLFFLLGLGLAFTPCVLPMVPILSSIIMGEGAQVPRSRAFILSVAYALGMAIVYTALGVTAGLLGEGLSATLQNPWVLGLFALVMVALALSMFGVYQLQVPAVIQSRLMQVSEHQSAGKLFGVFVMGAISALIVGPCVAAPLAGALVYISQTRDVVIGGSALFAMAAGMSVPLLLIGVSAGALLPRAGAWMETVKRFFGVLMLALALWMVVPVLPGWLVMLGWATLGLGYGIFLLRPLTGGFSITFGLVLAVFGLVQLVGVASGGRSAWAPLSHLVGNAEKPLQFTRVRSVAELDMVLASAQGKTVMLDFYADWCVSCKEMEKLTFTDPRVRAQMSKLLLLQADVTANNADDKALLKRFKLFGPPGIIFFTAQGAEIQGARIIGYQNADRFTRSLVLVL